MHWLLLFFLKTLIVCPDGRNIQKCAEETLKKRIIILDIQSGSERGVFEIKYQEIKE
jgi:hypothetical protein